MAKLLNILIIIVVDYFDAERERSLLIRLSFFYNNNYNEKLPIFVSFVCFALLLLPPYCSRLFINTETLDFRIIFNDFNIIVKCVEQIFVKSNTNYIAVVGGRVFV